MLKYTLFNNKKFERCFVLRYNAKKIYKIGNVSIAALQCVSDILETVFLNIIEFCFQEKFDYRSNKRDNERKRESLSPELKNRIKIIN